MNSTLARALVLAVPIGVLFVCSAASARRTAHTAAVLRLAGSVCLLVMVLTHIAEARRWFTVMRWGEPHSPGHYLDLTSAITGGALVIASYILPFVHRQTH